MHNKFSTRIKELRISKNLTQGTFAESINVSPSAISSYEIGARSPSLDMMLNIAQKYNVSIDWLCGLDDKMTSSNHIITYKELFKLFIDVLSTRYQDKQTTYIFEDISTQNMSVVLTLHDDANFQNFFSKWCDIFKLHNEGTIDDDLYQTWLDKQLDLYDKPINGCPF